MTLRPVLLLLVAVSAPAVEVVRRDVQFSLGSAPTEFDYTIDSQGGSFSGSDAFDAAWQARLGGRWALTSPGWSVAPIVGGDLVYGMGHGSGGDLTLIGIGAAAGVAWAIDERWALDAELGLGYDYASLEVDSLSGSGALFPVDLRVRVLRQLDRRWSIGLEVGWSYLTGSLDADGDREVEWDSSGFTAGLLITWRLSMRPAALE
jgi:hypothetical protein